MEKMSLAVMYDFVVYRPMPLLSIEIAIEVTKMRNGSSRLVIPLELYLVFLIIPCHTYLDNLKLVEHLAVVIENTVQHTPNEEKLSELYNARCYFGEIKKVKKGMRYYCLAHVYLQKKTSHLLP